MVYDATPSMDTLIPVVYIVQLRQIKRFGMLTCQIFESVHTHNDFK